MDRTSLPSALPPKSAPLSRPNVIAPLRLVGHFQAPPPHSITTCISVTTPGGRCSATRGVWPPSAACSTITFLSNASPTLKFAAHPITTPIPPAAVAPARCLPKSARPFSPRWPSPGLRKVPWPAVRPPATSISSLSPCAKKAATAPIFPPPLSRHHSGRRVARRRHLPRCRGRPRRLRASRHPRRAFPNGLRSRASRGPCAHRARWRK